MEKSKNKKAGKFPWKKAFIIVISVPAALALIAVCTGIIILHTGGEQIDAAKLNFTPSGLKITDNAGQYVELPEKYDVYASSEEIPDILKKAFVTLEDKRFYSHHGVDYLRMGKAAIKNIAAGSIKEGASTITQQLVKNTHLTSEKSFGRKISEARLAIKLEKMYTKDEILTMYLNMLYFGSGEYGVKNAARRFFGKELSQLNTAECAMLAGIVKSPTRYNPINNFARSNERKDLVLDIMAKEGAIDKNEYEKAKKYEIIIKNDIIENNSAIYFLEYTIKESCSVLDISPEQLLSGDYTIETYLDKDSRNIVEKIMSNPALTLKNAGGELPDCAAVVLDNSSGGIKAFYSNCGYSPETRRQPGSTLKPLVSYAPALDCGAVYPATIIDDRKKDFSGYSPNNYKDEYYGKISVRESLMLSLNVPAVEVMSMVGVEKACSYLPKLGIETEDSDYNFATALGGMTYGTNITNIAAAYSVFARDGKFIPHSFVRQIKNSEGEVLYRRGNAARQVFGADTAYLITDMLADTAKMGSAKKLSGLKFPIASKTGTVSASDKNYNTDVYNVSYTTSETAVFWQGNMSGEQSDMLPADITGGGSPTLMAKNYFSRSDAAKNEFPVPSTVKPIMIDSFEYTCGRVVLADSSAPEYAVRRELFSVRHLPKERNNSFTFLKKPEVTVENGGNIINVLMQTDPRLRYTVIKRDYFSGDCIVAEFGRGTESGNFAVAHRSDVLFAPRYIVEVYYICGDGEKISATFPLDLRAR